MMASNDSALLALLLLSVIILTAVQPSVGLTKPSGVKLVNNEYTGLVVAIHPDEDENSKIIDVIKDMFTNGSSYLYNATKKRAFFKEVTILIPQTWSDKSTYSSPGNATFNGADLIIAPHNPRFAPDGPNTALPYTKQLAGCGEQSLYIHMTSTFLLRYRHLQARVGDYGRVLVHEWGHYRWGLFNEYPDERIDLQAAEYFYFSVATHKWEHVSCPTGWTLTYLKKVDNSEGKYRDCEGDEVVGYEEGCFTEATKGVQPNISGSIMQSVLFPEVTNFCDSDVDESYLHNSEAPTEQNKFCDGRSSWDVMREHPDFNGYTNNPPREVEDVTPTFHVVRAKKLRIVLVLDTSGSMSTNNRHMKLAAAARNFITSVAPDGSFIGLVDFDGDGIVLSDLREITSSIQRRNLANLVPEDADGGTCIGCGMREALNILRRSNSDVGGSKIMLITDGEDGEKQLTNSMKYEYIQNKVIIDSIVISSSASTELENLAKETGGQFDLQTDSSESTGISDAFAKSYESGGTREYDRRLELQSTVASFLVGKTEFRNSVYIDSTLGRATVFDFTYFTTSGVAIDVRLTSPTGETFDQSSDEYHNDGSFRKVVIEINGIAEPGSWEYIIQNLATNEAHDVPISVSSYPSEEGVDPIIVDSYLSSSETDVKNNKSLVVYAEVRQGFDPVINAIVIGIIDTPSGEPKELELLDNGAGADVTKDDGIYSRYFTQFTGTGFYGFKLQVENQGSATVLKPGAWRFSGIKNYFDPDILLAGNVSVYGNDKLALPGGPLPELVGEPAPYFTRGVSGGASSVPELPVGWTPDADAIPPSKITDLTVFYTSFEKGLVHVKFTAPGDDLDFGSAHHYIIRWSNSSLGLRKQQDFYQELDQTDIVFGNLLSPSPFGSPESIAFRISFPKDKDTVSYLIGVYAIDEADNEASMSNLAQAAFRRYIPPPLEDRISPTTEETTTLEKKMKTRSRKDDKDDVNGINYRRRRLGIVIGGVFVVIYITVLGIVLANALRNRQRFDDRNTKTEYAKYDPAGEVMLAKV